MFMFAIENFQCLIYLQSKNSLLNMKKKFSILIISEKKCYLSMQIKHFYKLELGLQGMNYWIFILKIIQIHLKSIIHYKKQNDV